MFEFSSEDKRPLWRVGREQGAGFIRQGEDLALAILGVQLVPDLGIEIDIDPANGPQFVATTAEQQKQGEITAHFLRTGSEHGTNRLPFGRQEKPFTRAAFDERGLNEREDASDKAHRHGGIYAKHGLIHYSANGWDRMIRYVSIVLPITLSFELRAHQGMPSQPRLSGRIRLRGVPS